MQPFGQYLKSEREKRSIRLEEIASSTKIHIQNLNLMEEDRWQELPQEPFIRGFISAYARYLGLDNKETLKLFSLYKNPPEKISEENLQASASIEPETSTRMRPSPELSSEDISSVEQQETSKVKRSFWPKSPQLNLVITAVFLLIVTAFVVISKQSNETPEPLAQNQINPATTPPPVAESTSSTTTSGVEGTSSIEVPAPSETAETSVPKTETVTPKKELEIKPVTQLQTENKTGVEPTNKTDSELESQKAPTPGQTANPPQPTPSAQVAVSNPPAKVAEPANKDEKTSSESKIPETESKKIETTPPISGHELSVEVKNKSWLKVVIDDNPPKESFLEAGAKANFQAKEKIKIVLGNSSGATVLHNGEESQGKKFLGTIREYIFPKRARFPQDNPKSKPSTESSDKEDESSQSNLGNSPSESKSE